MKKSPDISCTQKRYKDYWKLKNRSPIRYHCSINYAI